MTTKYISIAEDFSPFPAGRFVADGPFPGEVFRDKYLAPALREFEQVTVDFDGTDGLGSSFLEEAFGGLVREGFSEHALKSKLKIKSARSSYEVRAWNYIQQATSAAH